jgi:YccS/YhfK family integral membrane protein
VNENWKAGWQRARNHEGFTRGMQALLALGCVLALGWRAGWEDELMPVVLGVIACALTETDDDWRGRLKTLLMALPSFALMMTAVWFALPWPVLLAALLALSAFCLTLLGALGERYRALAFGALVLFNYTALSAHSLRDQALELAPYLLGGAVWYGLISLLWAALWPKPTVRYRLSQLYALLGEYLRLKALLLEPVAGADRQRRRLELALHNGHVVNALNATKESLLARIGSRQPPVWLREAMQQYLAAQDIHERVSSSHESYTLLSETFARSDALYRCQRVLSVLGEQSLKLSQAIRESSQPRHEGQTARAIQDMQAAIRHLEAGLPGASGPRPLKALRALGDNLTELARVFGQALSGGKALDLALFDHQVRSFTEALRRLRGQFTLRSALMRHALRLSLMLLLAFGVMQATHDPHGYWIVLTVAFASQPQFGATLNRLLLRSTGTVLGLAVGWALIRLFPGPLLQAVWMVLAGALFIGKRGNDVRMAAGAITAMVLMSFHQMGMAQGVIPARLLDTAIGSLIAGLGAWLVLPNWQALHWPRLAAQALRAHAGYLRAILEQYQAGKQDHLTYRLARRNAHNADAALSNAYAAMREEPRRERLDMIASARFLVLSHMLLNYLSALGAHRGELDAGSLDETGRRTAGWLQQSLAALAQGLETGQAVPASGSRMAFSSETPKADGISLLQAQLELAAQLLPELEQAAARLLEPR